MSEARDFIPTGACVEKDAELFARPATAQLAKAACKSCIQLSYCQEQREVIGTILQQRGEVQPVVGGKVVSSEVPVDTSTAVQFGEVTLRFDRKRLPEDGDRALHSMQQALRAGQVGIRGLTAIARHPTIDVAEWVITNLTERNPEALAPFDQETLGRVATEIENHILMQATRRMPNGAPVPMHLRYRIFDPEKYYAFAHAFIKEVAANAAFGLPDPARRTSYHDAAFHRAYFAEGEQAGIGRSYLERALIHSPLNATAHAHAQLRGASKRHKATHQQQREEKHLAASRIKGTLEDIFSDQDPNTVEHIRQIFNYRVILIDANNERPTIRIHDRFTDFTDAEKAAIIHALGFAPFAGELPAADKVETALRVENLHEHVFTTLLPQLDPEIFARDKAAEDIRQDPHALLGVIRRELWAGMLTVRPGNAKAKLIEAKLLDAISVPPEVPHSAYRRGVQQLYNSTQQLLVARDLGLSNEVFLDLHSFYQQDVQALIREGVAGAVAPSLALRYTADSYKRIKDYALRNPDVSRGYIDKVFNRGARNSPLQKIRIFERRFTAFKTNLGRPHPFSDSNLRSLAFRGMELEEGEALAEVTRRMIERHKSQVIESDIRRICVIFEGDEETLENILSAKRKKVTQLVKLHSHAIPFARLKPMIIRSPLGEEEAVIQRFYRRREKVREYLDRHPHSDVDEFIIDTIATTNNSPKDWLSEYEANMKLVRASFDTRTITPPSLRKIVATHRNEPVRAVERFRELQAIYEFDPYIESWMIDDALVPNLGRTFKRVRLLRRLLQKGKGTPTSAEGLQHKFSSNTAVDELSTANSTQPSETYENRQEIAGMLQQLDRYERAAVSLAFDLDWLAEDDELEFAEVLGHFKLEDGNSLEQYVESNILPKLRG